MKILVVEDNRLSRLMLEKYFSQMGYQVVVARDGLEALEVYHNEPIKMIVTDWEMPRMNGLEFIQQVRQEEHDERAYIILLTIKDQKQEIIAGISGGADDYVQKPFDKEELEVRINAGRRILKMQQDLKTHIASLEEAISHIKTLQGIIPICMHCHSIRDDKESWERIETYISRHSEAEFSHSLCPACMEKYYSDLDE